MALVHFPVLNKQGDIVTSSVTTLDVHDISRICRTYAIETFFVVTPLLAQQQLVGKIVEHWMEGFGATYNPTRKEALTTACVRNNLQEVSKTIASTAGRAPRILVPDARRFPKSVSYTEARRVLNEEDGPFLILFGTAWGLERNLVERADMVLDPIEGLSGYNHLPVRAAAAVILDRLLADREP